MEIYFIAVVFITLGVVHHLVNIKHLKSLSKYKVVEGICVETFARSDGDPFKEDCARFEYKVDDKLKSVFVPYGNVYYKQGSTYKLYFDSKGNIFTKEYLLDQVKTFYIFAGVIVLACILKEVVL